MSFPDTLNLNYLIEELNSKHQAKKAETEGNTVIETDADNDETTNDDGKL